MEDTIKKILKQATDYKKIFPNYLSKGLVSIIYKEYFTKDDELMTSKNIKIFSVY